MSPWGRVRGSLGGRKVYTTASEYGFSSMAVSLAVSTSTTWPLANLAIYVPVLVDTETVIKQCYVMNGAAVSGNIDIGVYALDGTRLVSAGSTAQAGISSMQVFDVTDTLLTPGTYYLALALDNTTGTVSGQTLTVAQWGQVIGCAEQTSAFALPATATFASFTRLLNPTCGLTGQTVV